MPTSSLVSDLDALPDGLDVATRQARATRILVVAALAGLTGDTLLRAPGIGLNLSLYLLLLIAGLAAVSRARWGRIPLAQLEPLAAATVFSIAIVVRDAGFLTLENLVAVLVTLGVAALWATDRAPSSIGRLDVGDVLHPAARGLPRAMAGGVGFLRNEAPLLVAGRTRYLLLAGSLGRAGAIALLFAASFALLLAMGDAVFGKALTTLTAVDATALAGHFVFLALFAWPALGWLHASTRDISHRASSGRTLSSFDTTAVLTGMLTVFGLFLAVQVRILFGGQAYVMSVTGLSLAEYARSGFFVLVGVTALVLGVLQTLDAFSPHGSLAMQPRHRLLARVLVGMVALMLCSAAARMNLYVAAYGLTTDRLHAVVGMLWIAIALSAFLLTTLRGHRGRFAGWALRSAWLVLLGVNLLNPDAMIVQVNAARAAQGAEFDAPYHTSLSADAVPQVLRELQQADRSRDGWCTAATTLLQTHGPTRTPRSIGTWNFGAWRAQRAVTRSQPMLEVTACPQTSASPSSCVVAPSSREPQCRREGYTEHRVI